jgi:hypothetical protein
MLCSDVEGVEESNLGAKKRAKRKAQRQFRTSASTRKQKEKKINF